MSTSYSSALRDNNPSNGSDIIRARILGSKRTAKRLADWVHDYAQLRSRQSAELERFLSRHVLNDEELGTLSHPWQSVAGYVLKVASSSDSGSGRLKAEVEKQLREIAQWTEVDSVFNQLQSSHAILDSSLVDNFESIDLARLDKLKMALARFATIETDISQSAGEGCQSALQAWIGFTPEEDVNAFAAQIISGVAATAPVAASEGPRSYTSANDHNSSNARSASGASESTVASRVTRASDTTQKSVRRKSSLLFLSGDSKQKSDKSEKSSLKSKVGSIFGRKKNKNPSSNSNSLATIDDDSNYSGTSSSQPHTQPADFGLVRRPSIQSIHSHNSHASSLRQPRNRAMDDDVYGSNSPFRSNNSPMQRARVGNMNTGTINSVPKFNDAGAPRLSSPVSSPPVLQQNTLSQSATGSSTFILLNPLIPNNVKPKAPKQPNASPFPLPMGLNPPNTFNEHGIAAVTSQGTGPTEPMTRDVTGASIASSEAPTPPPARQNSVRNSIQGAPIPRPASQTTMTQSQRQQRVASHLFANLNPAHETNRDSVVHSGPIGGFAENPGQENPSKEPETQDTLGSLRSSGANASNQSAPGSPDQFWTPAQRFPSQFPSINPQSQLPTTATPSTTSLSGPQAAYPPVPEGSGLVAVSIETVEAEYNGDALVKSSVSGRASAVFNGTLPTGNVPLGLLLADQGAKLTPCPLLKQTTPLSYEVPPASYGHLQELCTYNVENGMARVPIKLVPLWRIDQRTVRLVLSYQLSDLYVGGDSATIQNLVISVTIGGTTRAISAQSKPVATFSKEKQRITWRLPAEQKLERGVVAGKLLCQFTTEGEGASPGPIELRARVIDVTNSLLQLRTLSPEGEWVSVPTNVVSDVSTRKL